jgi:hypothetical protein
MEKYGYNEIAGIQILNLSWLKAMRFLDTIQLLLNTRHPDTD